MSSRVQPRRQVACALAAAGSALVLWLGLAWIGSGCAAVSDQASSPKPGEGIAEYRKVTQEARQAVGATVTSLEALARPATRPSTPHPALSGFDRAFEKLELTSITARARAEAIIARGQAYFDEWKEQLAAVNTTPQAQAESQRYAGLLEHFENVRARSGAVRQEFQPFMSKLREFRATLDRAPESVESSRQELAGLTAQGRRVLERLESVSAALDDAETQLRATLAAHPPTAENKEKKVQQEGTEITEGLRMSSPLPLFASVGKDLVRTNQGAVVGPMAEKVQQEGTEKTEGLRMSSPLPLFASVGKVAVQTSQEAVVGLMAEKHEQEGTEKTEGLRMSSLLPLFAPVGADPVRTSQEAGVGLMAEKVQQEGTEKTEVLGMSSLLPLFASVGKVAVQTSQEAGVGPMAEKHEQEGTEKTEGLRMSSPLPLFASVGKVAVQTSQEAGVRLMAEKHEQEGTERTEGLRMASPLPLFAPVGRVLALILMFLLLPPVARTQYPLYPQPALTGATPGASLRNAAAATQTQASIVRQGAYNWGRRATWSTYRVDQFQQDYAQMQNQFHMLRQQFNSLGTLALQLNRPRASNAVAELDAGLNIIGELFTFLANQFNAGTLDHKTIARTCGVFEEAMKAWERELKKNSSRLNFVW